MQQQQFVEILDRIWQDDRITRSETEELDTFLEDTDADDHALALYRHLAFDRWRETRGTLGKPGRSMFWRRQSNDFFQVESATSRPGFAHQTRHTLARSTIASGSLLISSSKRVDRPISASSPSPTTGLPTPSSVLTSEGW